ncbi:hypothetical protein BC835DRAFT_328422 [Cytidiella melzeri]|nr:hypothetical protein BC835DRAFT_328422 [Cytidiella melzeri]
MLTYASAGSGPDTALSDTACDSRLECGRPSCSCRLRSTMYCGMSSFLAQQPSTAFLSHGAVGSLKPEFSVVDPDVDRMACVCRPSLSSWLQPLSSHAMHGRTSQVPSSGCVIGSCDNRNTTILRLATAAIFITDGRLLCYRTALAICDQDLLFFRTR